MKELEIRTKIGSISPQWKSTTQNIINDMTDRKGDILWIYGRC